MMPTGASVTNRPAAGCQAMGQLSPSRVKALPTWAQLATAPDTEDVTVMGEETPFILPTLTKPRTWPEPVWKSENVIWVATDPEPPPLKMPNTMKFV